MWQLITPMSVSCSITRQIPFLENCGKSWHLLCEQIGTDITHQRNSKFRKTGSHKEGNITCSEKGENYSLPEAQRPVGNYNIRK